MTAAGFACVCSLPPVQEKLLRAVVSQCSLPIFSQFAYSVFVWVRADDRATAHGGRPHERWRSCNARRHEHPSSSRGVLYVFGQPLLMIQPYFESETLAPFIFAVVCSHFLIMSLLGLQMPESVAVTRSSLHCGTSRLGSLGACRTSYLAPTFQPSGTSWTCR